MMSQTTQQKIYPIEELARILDEKRAQKQRIVHCHGVFGLLHIGHIRHFEEARAFGDLLVVTLTEDKFVNKGPHRPAFAEDLRTEAIAALRCVDYVAVNRWPTAVETINLLRPDFYVKGPDYKNQEDDCTGGIVTERDAVEAVGGEMVFTEDVAFSSSNLINRYLSNLPEEINEYLEVFRTRHSLDELMASLERMASLKVLVVGDTILDEYQYCQAMGKSSKDPVLALKYESQDLFAGGVLAVANHVAQFAGQVDLLSVIGERDSHESFIREQLNSKITPTFFVQPDAPTLIKRRFIDGYSFNKLFEVYVMDDSGLPDKENLAICQWLDKRLEQYDLVIAMDFGHGAISREMIAKLTAKSKFLAVNTQANAGNRGLHTISRYPRMDYACIAEHELVLETRDTRGDIRLQMQLLVEKLICQKFVVTRGRRGCAVSESGGVFTQVPTFATNIVDRVGAGDAFFSVTALAAVQDVESEILGFLGSVAGSLAVEIIGNKKSIDKVSMQKYITALLK